MTKSRGIGRGRRPLIPIADRFWPKVDKRGPDECWPWIGARHGAGYGHIGAGGTDGQILKAQRVSWEIHFGPIPDGLFVLHDCDNPPCVNPGHLFLGTHDDNMADMAAKGRAKPPGLAGEDQPMSKLNGQQVLEIRRLYAETKISQRDLAVRFSVCQQSISLITKNKNWRHI